jgi:hypothetical protein
MVESSLPLPEAVPEDEIETHFTSIIFDKKEPS